MENIEIWKPINGYEGLYEVSNLGNIKTLERIYLSGNGKKAINKVKEKLIKTYNNGHGYSYVSLRKNGIKTAISVHRIVAKEFIPNINNLKCVNHKNGIKNDNRVENLEWCTYKENSEHAKQIGLIKSGELHHNSLLTNKQVLEIRNKYSSKNFTLKMIGDEYGINYRTVSQIVNYKRYANVI